jgi:apolipoprotein N-acyltransferase
LVWKKGRKSWRGLLAGTAVWVLVEGLTAGLSKPTPDQRYHVALIQPDVTMEEKMSPDPEAQRQRYFDLEAQTAKAFGENEKSGFDLVVWPESAVPNYFDEMVAGGAFVDQLKQGDFTLVTGADHREWDKLYNSIAIMRGTVENRAIHPKIRLVPFGEFIPFRKEVPLFEKLLGDLIPVDFNAGTSLEPMRVEGQPFSMVPLVCFEDTLGEHARRFIRAEPQVMVNVTNDNWFHESPATEMHFANARWRAVELRRTLVRSANTGVTAIVSPWGHVQRISSHQQGVVSGEFSTGTGEITFYARHGDLFSQVAGTVGLLGCVAVAVSRRRRRFLP